MKHTYCSPQTECIIISTSSIICGSGGTPIVGGGSGANARVAARTGETSTSSSLYQ